MVQQLPAWATGPRKAPKTNNTIDDEKAGQIPGFLRLLHITRESVPYLEEQAGSIAVAVGYAFDHLDPVVDTFEHAGIELVMQAGDDAVDVSFQSAKEAYDRGQSGFKGQPIPLLPALSCIGHAQGESQPHKPVLEHIDLH